MVDRILVAVGGLAAASALTLALTSCASQGAERIGAAQGTETKAVTATSAVPAAGKAAAIGPKAPMTGPGAPPVGKPCPGTPPLPPKDHPGGVLTDADLARQTEHDKAAEDATRAAVQQLIEAGVDLTKLPRHETLRDRVVAPPATPAEAAAKADGVFVGTVQSLDFSLDGIAVADVVIDEVVRGDLRVGQTVPVELGFVLGINADCTGGVIGVDPGSPVLQPSQQAVFMPDSYPQGIGESPAGLWVADTYAQAYPITGDTVSAEPTSRFGKLVHDVPVADFLDSLS